ncbi:hypothetical protein V1509DRAFT_56962 [Lipomyces kononenkoae]
MSAEQQLQSPTDLSSPKRQATDIVPVPPLRSPKRSPVRAKIGIPLSDVPTNDSRRNSPSTADHQRFILQQQKNSDTEIHNKSLGFSDPPKSVEAGETIHLSPSTKQSAMSFWYDKERESLNREQRSPTIDGSPIINGSVRNSIFHQNADSYQRPLPSSPVIQSPQRKDETPSEQEMQGSPVTRPRHVGLEKRSSLLSSSGSIRSKKVTFEMAPPQVVEFEATQDSPITTDANSEESDEGEVFEFAAAELNTQNHAIDKPASPLIKFESSFSPGVYLHRTLSGSRSLPKPSAHTFNTKGRPLPAVPSKQCDNLDPQKINPSPPVEKGQSETGLMRQDSVMSRVSEASSYDAMDLLDSYTFEDVNIDNEPLRHEFDSPSNSETVVGSGGDPTVPQSSTGPSLTYEAHGRVHGDERGFPKSDTDEQAQEDSSLSNYSPEMSSLWSGDTTTTLPHDVSVKISDRTSNGYEYIDLSKSHDTDRLPLTQDTGDTTLSSAHTRTDSTTSFKLELSFDATDNDFGSGLNDYLNSSSFLAKSWMDETGRNSTSLDTPPQCDIPAEDRTIKSRCGAKTRPSLTPADAVNMASTRRKVSGDHAEHKFLELPSIVEDLPKPTWPESLLLDLDVNDFSFDSLSKDFDRVIEVQKRGYLMRENTRIVHAYADTDFGDSPEKTYQPWTGAREPKEDQTLSGKSCVRSSMLIPEKEPQERENSVKKSLIIPDGNNSDLGKHSKASEAKPRLPTAGHNEEMKPAKPVSVDVDPNVDPADRGRLFVKVLALKDLKLPLSDDTSAYFALTLDNGIHCVTTAYMNLTRNAPIYQEFELIVGTELEFILTLKAKITQPATRVSRSPSPKKKESRFGIDKLFGSPKRRVQPAESATKHSPLALGNVLGSDGSFARSYISFSQIEKEIYLTSKILEVPCYNEWATEFDATRSRKAERVRTPPYPIGKIVLQLLYYPKTYRHQEIPRSLNACLRELNNSRQ